MAVTLTVWEAVAEGDEVALSDTNSVPEGVGVRLLLPLSVRPAEGLVLQLKLPVRLGLPVGEGVAEREVESERLWGLGVRVVDGDGVSELENVAVGATVREAVRERLCVSVGLPLGERVRLREGEGLGLRLRLGGVRVALRLRVLVGLGVAEEGNVRETDDVGEAVAGEAVAEGLLLQERVAEGLVLRLAVEREAEGLQEGLRD